MTNQKCPPVHTEWEPERARKEKDVKKHYKEGGGNTQGKTTSGGGLKKPRGCDREKKKR